MLLCFPLLIGGGFLLSLFVSLIDHTEYTEEECRRKLSGYSLGSPTFVSFGGVVLFVVPCREM